MKLRRFMSKNLVIVASGVLGVISGLEAANPNVRYPMQPQQSVQQSQSDKALPAQINRINRLANEGQVDQAMAEVENAISMFPNNLRLYKLRAHLYVAQKQYEQAIQDLNYLIIQDPEDAKLYLDRGIALFKAGNYKDAARNAKRAMQLDVNSVEARELLMQTNYKMHKK